MNKIIKFPRTLGVFTLAMINVAAIGSVKNWPFTAEYGFASIFFLLLAGLVFFLPVSFIAAELATSFPKQGGVYTWVKEAFGPRIGFLAIWLLWVENVFWYPTILSFISATIAYIFNPNLAENMYYTGGIVLLLFWGATLANLFGMRTSGMISDLGAFCGTLIPGALIIGLGLLWYFGGNALEIPLTAESLVPEFTFDNFIIFTGVLLTLAGMEMSAVHARDVQNAKRDYPRAILLSALLILGLSILGVFSIAMVIPHNQISLVAGSMQAISVFMGRYHLGILVPLIAALIAVGAFGSVSTWIIGPSKGLLSAAQDGDMPKIFSRTNRHGAPTTLLFAQGVVVTILSLLFLLMPTVSSVFWLLTILVAQLYLLMYLLMFAAALYLRYKQPHLERPYKVPGGKWGIWIVGIVGMAACLFALLVGYVPPKQIAVGSPTFYVGFLLAGTAIGCLLPFLIYQKRRT